KCSGSLLTESIIRESTSANSTSTDKLAAVSCSARRISDPMTCSAPPISCRPRGVHCCLLPQSHGALEPIFDHRGKPPFAPPFCQNLTATASKAQQVTLHKCRMSLSE